MFQLLIIVGIVVIEFCVLKNILSVNVKDYQGFSTRFFSPSNNSISTGSVIFWILASPIFSSLAYIFTLFVNSTLECNYIQFDMLWLISVLFWLWFSLLVFVLGRRKLVNWLFVSFIAGSSILFNWYLSSISFTGDVKDILPNANNTTFQLYLILGIFLVSTIQIIYERDDYDLRRTRFILEKLDLYLSKFKVLFELEGEELYLALAILIVEDFERPKFIRYIENIIKSSTRNIAQNDSRNDNHSVSLLVKEIHDLYIIGEDDYPYQRIRNFALKYNNSSRYADDVWKIYDEVSKLDENIKLLKKTNHNVSEELI
ncbi:hypothetical protein EHS16_04335 [Streptococcus anginosus]|uniref:Uncharacterized protein n=2 Tax=Streptococcus anginosus TaxID=1328 RepID=A0ABD4U2B2_STRAP|nr:MULTISPECIES: hypothetical protein [Streptococcus]EJP27234.1 hypothetical protein HMPREF1126_1103 [Streptococcus anginosus SK1138]KAA9296525.1 hypothetical protein F6I09_05515 [Streptococcus anginosus]KUL99949.1 hypothetical protein RN81_06830 [Streptococcus anginosus]MCW1060138.1 hypothetical protein [Streptococcus anginosus]MCW1076749.1 hypothetical protein [Streptococcus anginosus]